MTRTERLVFDLSTKTFLSFWTYPNPKREDNKELCDLLVSCGQDLLIFSVKEIIPTDSGREVVDWNRWRKAAIDKSVNQIYGAERFLAEPRKLHLSDGSEIPPEITASDRNVHRIAVAIGGEGKMPLMWGDFGKGFVHVFDEISLNAILGELDTITDFVEYLSKKEALYAKQDRTDFLLDGGEEDLLAFYLTNDMDFGSEADLISLSSNLWDSFTNSEAYAQWRKFISASSFWDGMIELLTNDHHAGNLIGNAEYEDFDSLIRTMAMESRASRAELSNAFADFLSKPETRSRFVVAMSGVGYVFLAPKRSEDREFRRVELIGRCLIVRRYADVSRTVIGIATEKRDEDQSFTFDHVFLDFETFPEHLEEKVRELARETGWFKKLTRS